MKRSTPENANLLKQVCVPILKNNMGKKHPLMNMVNKKLLQCCGAPLYRLDTKLFYFASFATLHEKVSIARAFRSGYSYYMHTNKVTKIRRKMRFNHFNDQVSNNKARATKAPYTRNYTLDLEDLYEFKCNLFNDDDDLPFTDYANIILPPILETVAAMDIVALYHRDFIVEDNTSRLLPQVRWIKGREAVDITCLKGGFDIDLSIDRKGIRIPVISSEFRSL